MFSFAASRNRRYRPAVSCSDAQAATQFIGLPSRVVEGIRERKLRLLERISQIEGKRRRKAVF
jgi:hypothetical protein